MSIADNLSRIKNAKTEIVNAIDRKGVAIDQSIMIEDIPAKIDQIKTGSSIEGIPFKAENITGETVPANKLVTLKYKPTYYQSQTLPTYNYVSTSCSRTLTLTDPDTNKEYYAYLNLQSTGIYLKRFSYNPDSSSLWDYDELTITPSSIGYSSGTFAGMDILGEDYVVIYWNNSEYTYVSVLQIGLHFTAMSDTTLQIVSYSTTGDKIISNKNFTITLNTTSGNNRYFKSYTYDKTTSSWSETNSVTINESATPNLFEKYANPYGRTYSNQWALIPNTDYVVTVSKSSTTLSIWSINMQTCTPSASVTCTVTSSNTFTDIAFFNSTYGIMICYSSSSSTPQLFKLTNSSGSISITELSITLPNTTNILMMNLVNGSNGEIYLVCVDNVSSENAINYAYITKFTLSGANITSENKTYLTIDSEITKMMYASTISSTKYYNATNLYLIGNKLYFEVYFKPCLLSTFMIDTSNQYNVKCLNTILANCILAPENTGTIYRHTGSCTINEEYMISAMSFVTRTYVYGNSNIMKYYVLCALFEGFPGGFRQVSSAHIIPISGTSDASEEYVSIKVIEPGTIAVGTDTAFKMFSYTANTVGNTHGASEDFYFYKYNFETSCSITGTAYGQIILLADGKIANVHQTRSNSAIVQLSKYVDKYTVPTVLFTSDEISSPTRYSNTIDDSPRLTGFAGNNNELILVKLVYDSGYYRINADLYSVSDSSMSVISSAVLPNYYCTEILYIGFIDNSTYLLLFLGNELTSSNPSVYATLIHTSNNVVSFDNSIINIIPPSVNMSYLQMLNTCEFSNNLIGVGWRHRGFSKNNIECQDSSVSQYEACTILQVSSTSIDVVGMMDITNKSGEVSGSTILVPKWLTPFKYVYKSDYSDIDYTTLVVLDVESTSSTVSDTVASWKMLWLKPSFTKYKSEGLPFASGFTTEETSNGKSTNVVIPYRYT